MAQQTPRLPREVLYSFIHSFIGPRPKFSSKIIDPGWKKQAQLLKKKAKSTYSFTLSPRNEVWLVPEDTKALPFVHWRDLQRREHSSSCSALPAKHGSEAAQCSTLLDDPV